MTNSGTGGLGYDASGNVTQDTFNTYVYDADGRVCAVKNNVAGVIQYMQYVYDAEGKRVAKGSIPSLPASGSACSAPVSANGFTLTNQYLRSANRDQDTEVLGTGTTASWHTNVYAEGKALATYSSGSGSNPPTLAFNFTDWLGTKRLQTTATGQISMTWASDPYGNYLKSTGTATDDTEEHFTGQQRDRETAGMANSSGPLNSGNDYFGARYYASSMGRFLSPDPSQLYYADPTNPQSLNLYSYGQNNPLINIDPTGLDACAYDNGDGTSTVLNDANGGAVDCPGNGFYITTTQQVTGVGYNGNGDLSVYGADGNLYNPDGSAYDAAQSITVNANGEPGLYTNSPVVSSGIQYVATLPSGFNQPPVGQGVVGSLWHYGNWCGSGGQGPAISATDAACIAHDAACIAHDACYFQGSFGAGSNFQRNQPGALQACNQALVDSAAARAGQLAAKVAAQPSASVAIADVREWQADMQIVAYFTHVPFGNAAVGH